MREETQSPYEICVYCKQPILEGTICKGMPHGQKAHLKCYVEHLDENANEIAP